MENRGAGGGVGRGRDCGAPAFGGADAGCSDCTSSKISDSISDMNLFCGVVGATSDGLLVAVVAPRIGGSLPFKTDQNISNGCTHTFSMLVPPRNDAI